MEIKKNSKLQERRHFLLRAINNGYKTKDECSEELNNLENEIQKNLIEALAEAKEEMKSEVDKIKDTTKYDGDFKRGVANYLINILSKFLTHDEVKGIFRQGYNIMRYK